MPCRVIDAEIMQSYIVVSHTPKLVPKPVCDRDVLGREGVTSREADQTLERRSHPRRFDLRHRRHEPSFGRADFDSRIIGPRADFLHTIRVLTAVLGLATHNNDRRQVGNDNHPRHKTTEAFRQRYSLDDVPIRDEQSMPTESPAESAWDPRAPG